MNKISKTLYEAPGVRVSPFSPEKCFLYSATVPGATIDDAEEEEWTVS